MRFLLKAIRTSNDDYYCVGRGFYAKYVGGHYDFYSSKLGNSRIYLGTLLYHKLVKSWLFVYKKNWQIAGDYEILLNLKKEDLQKTLLCRKISLDCE